MDKQTVVYHYNGILFRYKKYKVYICAIIWMILKNVKLSKKRQKQNVLYCTFFFFLMKHPAETNPQREHIIVHQERGESST